MGSGVLLAALVVLWFVVLVPMVVTRGDAQGGRVELADSGRTLQRRRTVDPVVHAETERVSVDRDALRTSGELQVDVHALRRRTLGGLVALALLAAGRRAVREPLAVDGAARPRPRRRRLPAGAAQGRPPRAAGRPPRRPCRGPRGAAHAGGSAEVPRRPRRRCTRRSARAAGAAAAPERSAGSRAPAPARPGGRGPHAGPGRLAAERRGRSGRRRHRFRRHRRTTSRAAWSTPEARPALRRRPGGGAGEPGRYSVRRRGCGAVR